MTWKTRNYELQHTMAVKKKNKCVEKSRHQSEKKFSRIKIFMQSNKTKFLDTAIWENRKISVFTALSQETRQIENTLREKTNKRQKDKAENEVGKSWLDIGTYEMKIAKEQQFLGQGDRSRKRRRGGMGNSDGEQHKKGATQETPPPDKIQGSDVPGVPRA